MSARTPPAANPVPPPSCPPEFPCSWAEPDDALLSWTLERAHWPDPMSPLVFAIAGDALARGLSAAMRAYGYPIAEVRVKRLNTYRYQAIVPAAIPPDERKAQDKRAKEQLRAVAGELSALWQSTWLPEVQAHLAHWECFNLQEASQQALLAHLDETVARAARLWEIHFVLLLPLYRAIADFARLYRDLFGDEDKLEAYRLLQGFDNKTLEMASALWQLSRQARQMPAVRTVLEEQVTGAVLPTLAHLPETQPFLTALHAYLREYGQRCTTWSIDTPSWIEDPSPVIKTLQDYVVQDDGGALTEKAAAAREREQFIAAARARLEGYPGPVRVQFDAQLKAAQEATVLSEDHGFWIDFRAMYQVRRVFMEWGHRFTRAGLLPTAADIFFLTLDEVQEMARSTTPSSRHALVTQRRVEMERFRAVVPPATLGAAPGAARVTLAPTVLAPGVLQGTAGSPGRVLGPARVVRSPRDAARVRQGDILVAETTSPSWTPLFATVGAVVTATGGVLSHSAIVAREYRIPAVVGLGPAAAGIQDGQLLEVDGAHGTVRIA